MNRVISESIRSILGPLNLLELFNANPRGANFEADFHGLLRKPFIRYLNHLGFGLMAKTSIEDK